MEKKYKSSLVVWRADEIPVIETFHADTKEEIDALIEALIEADKSLAKIKPKG